MTRRGALAQFTETSLRHLVVLDSGGNLVGVLDDRRVLSRWPLDAMSLHRQTVGQLVRPLSGDLPAPPPVHHAAPVSTAAALMLRCQVDALAVVDDQGTVVGIVTGSDLLRALVQIAADVSEQPAQEPEDPRQTATVPPPGPA